MCYKKHDICDVSKYGSLIHSQKLTSDKHKHEHSASLFFNSLNLFLCISQLPCLALFANAPKHPKRYDWLRYDRTYVGVKKDPRTCLTWFFFGPVIRVNVHSDVLQFFPGGHCILVVVSLNFFCIEIAYRHFVPMVFIIQCLRWFSGKNYPRITLIILFRISELGSLTNHLGSRQHWDTGQCHKL